MTQSDQRPSLVLQRLIDGYRISQAIYVAATLGIADLLVDGPRTSDDLATATGAHPQALYRLLRALASVGVFTEQADHHFARTPISDCLRSAAPDPVGGWAAFIGSPPHWRMWGDLLHSVVTGENAFRHIHGLDVWDYRARHPEEQASFDRAMTANARRNSDAILAAYDFGRFRHIVDVGGGQGALLSAILTHYPTMYGVLFDQPRVITGASERLRETEVAARCVVAGGDFFAAVPEGGDAYLLQHILHDWPDADATAILHTCRQAIAAEGRLLVIEEVIGPPNEGAAAKFTDLTMLVGPGGHERTQEEYTALLSAAGFQITSFVPTVLDLSIIEATPV
jgi:hypothetical protein